jgi:mannose-6-phosphate isomerase-like protein (cupin superfamily)
LSDNNLHHSITFKYGMMQKELLSVENKTGNKPEILSVVGHTIRVIAGGEQTSDAYSVFELTVPPNVGTGMHIDKAWDEYWFVIEGKFSFSFKEKQIELSSGGFAHGPKGIPHCFKNEGETTGKLVMVTTPSGLEDFFREVHEVSRTGRPDKETFVGIMRSHNIEPS